MDVVSASFPIVLIKDPAKKKKKTSGRNYILAHCSRELSIMVGESMWQELEATDHNGIHNEEAERGEGLRSAPFLHLQSRISDME